MAKKTWQKRGGKKGVTKKRWCRVDGGKGNRKEVTKKKLLQR